MSHCTPETNMMTYVNYISIKKNKSMQFSTLSDRAVPHNFNKDLYIIN